MRSNRMHAYMKIVYAQFPGEPGLRPHRYTNDIPPDYAQLRKRSGWPLALRPCMQCATPRPARDRGPHARIFSRSLSTFFAKPRRIIPTLHIELTVAAGSATSFFDESRQKQSTDHQAIGKIIGSTLLLQPKTSARTITIQLRKRSKTNLESIFFVMVPTQTHTLVQCSSLSSISARSSCHTASPS